MSEDVTLTLPIYNTPIIDARGNISEVWWRFFSTLLVRTGDTVGVDITIIQDNVNILSAAVALLQRLESSLDGRDAASVPVGQVLDDLAPPAVGALLRSIGEAPAPVAVPARLQQLSFIEVARNHGQQYDPGLHALVTTLFSGFMSAPDKVKLDALSVPIATPSEIVADVVTQNSTADGPVVTLTFPANSLTASASFNLRLYGLISSAALAGTLSVWIKIGATKVMTQTFTLPALGQTNTGLFYTASATVRTAGAGGTVQLSSLMTSNGNALNGGPAVASVGAAIDTTIANTITLGWNWSVANAANIATAKNASITLEKQ